jgi:hypothetical protein
VDLSRRRYLIYEPIQSPSLLGIVADIRDAGCRREEAWKKAWEFLPGGVNGITKYTSVFTGFDPFQLYI